MKYLVPADRKCKIEGKGGILVFTGTKNGFSWGIIGY